MLQNCGSGAALTARHDGARGKFLSDDIDLSEFLAPGHF